MKFEISVGDTFEFNFTDKVGELVSCKGILPLGINLYENALKGKVHSNAEPQIGRAHV